MSGEEIQEMNVRRKSVIPEEIEDSPVADFFKDQVIFVTGASGFIGKVLLEKLLRTCFDLHKIYILMRIKKGQHVKQRIHELLSGRLFDRVRKEQPRALSKVVALRGGIDLPDFGLSEDDKRTLFSEVTVVFHSAASVRFNEPLREAVKMNLTATRNVIDLSKKMTNLKSFVHVSTAYSNCDRSEIDEVVYDSPVSPQYMMDTMTWMNDELLDMITPRLLKNRPNTYTFTKALAENLVLQEFENLPVAIVRPSIVTASWNEPYPGWIDNLNTLNGLIVAVSKGLLRSLDADASKACDIVPVDVVVNLLITVAWHTAVHKPTQLMVYNCTSGSVNRLKVSEVMQYSMDFISRYPSSNVYRYPSCQVYTSRTLCFLNATFQHYLPAYLIDTFYAITGKKANMVNQVNLLHRVVKVLRPFMTNEWKFHCNNVLILMDDLTPQDQKLFNFNIKELDWSSYFENYLLGLREFVLKEDASTIPTARKAIRRLYFKTQVVNASSTLIFAYFFLKYSKWARNMWYFLISLLLQVYNALTFAQRLT